MLFQFVITAALLAVVSAQRYQMVPSDFNATAWKGLKSCVKATQKHYHVAADKGQLVFVPPTDAAPFINMSSTDEGLRECLASYSDYLNLAADSARYKTSNLSTVSFDTASVIWARRHGVQGIELVMRNDTAHFGTLSPASSVDKRQSGPGYYFAYLDQQYRGCNHFGLDTVYTSQCVSPGPKFYSVFFGNADRCQFLQVCAWYHHLCARDYSAEERKRSMRCVVMSPLRDSACKDDDTFSWSGHYFSPSC